MKSYGIKFIVFGWMILFSALYSYAAEAKGYKIVLASFGSFDEAKTALEKLGSKIGESEFALQKEYRFEMAARSSGKAYMLVIEPIETDKGAATVLKQFKKHYPDAYVNGYFGPTKGALFYKPSQVKKGISEANITEVNTTIDVLNKVEENSTVIPPVEPAVSQKDVIAESVTPEEPKGNYGWLVVLVIGGILLLGVWRVKSKKAPQPVQEFKEKYEEALQENESDDRVEMIESEAFSMVDEEEHPQNVPLKVFEPEPDIFYKLKKNMFFMTLMGELKSAADSKDDLRCHDLMDEVLRYQKNFRQSEMIAAMQNLLNTKAYDQLSLFINREMDQ